MLWRSKSFGYIGFETPVYVWLASWLRLLQPHQLQRECQKLWSSLLCQRVIVCTSAVCANLRAAVENVIHLPRFGVFVQNTGRAVVQGSDSFIGLAEFHSLIKAVHVCWSLQFVGLVKNPPEIYWRWARFSFTAFTLKLLSQYNDSLVPSDRPELGSNPDVNVHALIEATDTVANSGFQLGIGQQPGVLDVLWYVFSRFFRSGCLFRNGLNPMISTGFTHPMDHWMNSGWTLGPNTWRLCHVLPWVRGAISVWHMMPCAPKDRGTFLKIQTLQFDNSLLYCILS